MIDKETKAMINTVLERTGRTTRMVQHAVELAKQGRAVYVVMANDHQAQEFQKIIPTQSGIKFETHLSNLDWETMRLLGAHPNCVVLVDHYVIERRFSAMLEMLHAYDLTEEKNNV